MDVILYMLIQKEENLNANDYNQNNNNNINRENIQNNIREVINGRSSRYSRRGFNIFLLHGLSLDELRMMRIFFHLSAFQQSILRREDLDWSEEGMLQREERWLINQLNGPLLNNNNNEQEGDIEREIIIRNNNNNYIRLNINEDDRVTIRYEDTLFNFEFESIYIFLIGFCIGFIVNVFGILLCFCRFHKRFKIGLIWGIITSMIFYSMTAFSLFKI